MEEEKIKRVKLDDVTRENLEGLYKPDKIRKKNELKKKIEGYE